jgi:hypothetical protein
MPPLDGAEILFGLWFYKYAAPTALGTLQTATGTVAFPISIVAADVSPSLFRRGEKFEPTNVGCYAFRIGNLSRRN